MCELRYSIPDSLQHTHSTAVFYFWWYTVCNYRRPLWGRGEITVLQNTFNADTEHLWCYFLDITVHFAMLLELIKNHCSFAPVRSEFWYCDAFGPVWGSLWAAICGFLFFSPRPGNPGPMFLPNCHLTYCKQQIILGAKHLFFQLIKILQLSGTLWQTHGGSLGL